MKNAFKMGALAVIIAVSFAACKGSGSAGSSDSDTSKKADTAKVVADTAKKDTSKKLAADTAKKDTTKKK